MRGEPFGGESDSSDALRAGEELPGVEPALELLAFSRACTHLGCGLFFSCWGRQIHHSCSGDMENFTSRMTLSSSATRFCRRVFSSEPSFLIASESAIGRLARMKKCQPLIGIINFVDAETGLNRCRSTHARTRLMNIAYQTKLCTATTRAFAVALWGHE